MNVHSVRCLKDALVRRNRPHDLLDDRGDIPCGIYPEEAAAGRLLGAAEAPVDPQSASDLSLGLFRWSRGRPGPLERT